MFLVHCGLGVVALLEISADLHDSGFRIGEVSLFLGVWLAIMLLADVTLQTFFRLTYFL